MQSTLGNKGKFDFNGLFTFEMANNHQGSVEHGKRIIQEMAALARKHGVRAAVKLQFRDLDTFIHPDYRESTENKHIQRFLSTRLSEDEFGELLAEIKSHGLLTMVTPFDEASVDAIERLGADIIKIGSSSAHDWPLLERIADTGKPVICSTGGLMIRDIDRVVSFFQHRGVHFAIMYCVSMYPTPNNKLHLNQIAIMRNRYPDITVGWSTHESPSDTHTVRLAYAKGARIFEKHVGVPTDEIKLNAYSATPEEADAWVAAYKEAVEACGDNAEREIDEKETADLKSLMRGVYAKKEIKAGEPIKRSDVFFAMPIMEGQLTSGKWKEGLLADRDYHVHKPVSERIYPNHKSKKEIIYSTIHAVKGMLNTARIPLGHDFSVEISHHYGVENLHKIGCLLIECINREYAKKIIVQLPGQWNPVHYHKKKDETFQLLYGELYVEIEGKKKMLYPGDSLWVPRGVWHSFGTATGAIFEEISTASFNDDSFYVDREIAKMARDDRKTRLQNWGRHQFDEVKEEELAKSLR
ncbi:MAG: N-acetylneuraminate synthase family protein [Candidatus Sungbacteria bacterium]|nr:N-acetylneuraminate synthase family protein [Candidatus Sungbacteria bacterium]